MNGRVYDYNVGRFLSVDPFLQFPENSQSANPYTYILNNPMSGTDPTGYQSESDKEDATEPPEQQEWSCKGSAQKTCNQSGQGAYLIKVNSGDRNDSSSSKKTESKNTGKQNKGSNHQNTDFQTRLENGEFKSPVNEAVTAVFDALLNPMPEIEASIIAVMEGDYSSAVQAMFGIVGKKFDAAGKLGEGIVDGATKITGYTKHGLNQALGRDGGRGVKATAMLEAIRNPKKVIQQSNGATAYRGKKATVVLNKEGKVITTFGKSRGPQIWKQGASPKIKPQGSGSAQRKANELGFSYLPNSIR